MRYSCYALTLVLILAACARQSALAPLPSAGSSARSQSPNSKFQMLYSFKGKPDGMEPRARLAALHGVLYGMTEKGGKHDRGTIFQITPDGKETILHSFAGGKDDGAYPSSGFVEYLGNLYGVTEYGGASNGGTFFLLNPDGTPRLLYSFTQSTGANPTAQLLRNRGIYYGTTSRGGTHDAGTVYTITTDGQHHVLHNFAGGHNDGSDPEGGVAHRGGKFFGTTYRGGTGDRGTVFVLSRDGHEKVIHNFGATADDAAGPKSGLTLYGAFFGTSLFGGTKGIGTVYLVQPDGSERVVYSLVRKSGYAPYAGLHVYNGLLYGTASKGGSSNFGSVFSVDAGGTLTVLHDFRGKDGSEPRASLIEHDDKLYGTTYAGGGYSKGTVFEVTP